MIARIAADLLVVVHVGFILFVVFGGLLVLKWPRIAALHLPAAAWGALIEFCGWFCPLTPLENQLRRAGASQGYEGGFIDHYILPLVYPVGLDRSLQLVLGAAVIIINLAIYSFVSRRRVRATASSRPPDS